MNPGHVMHPRTARHFLTAGWLGYLACAAIYVVAGVRSGDVLSLIGSVFFLLATLAFLIPHIRGAPVDHPHPDDDDI